MTPLIAKGVTVGIKEPIVGVVNHSQHEKGIAFITKDSNSSCDPSPLCKITTEESHHLFDGPAVYRLNSLDHLETGDIVAVNPNGIINTLFRTNSNHNSLFITDRCNSNCLMCSQPPRNKDDLDYFYNINSKLLSLIPESTEVLGITGGEPTILGKRLFELIELSRKRLPNTVIHMLSNGRIFAWKNHAKEIAGLNENLIIGIPLYSDNYLDHDYIVQARNAFDQTILGLHNLERFGQRVEIRIVVHKLTYNRLLKLACFIYKNLPFVEHIAFMGLEYVGYTPYNHELLWIEPAKYSEELKDAVNYLDTVGMNVSIYNLQHCLLDRSLWRFSRKSISDWKRGYLDECKKCSLVDDCGGVFSTSKLLSSEIKAITD